MKARGIFVTILPFASRFYPFTTKYIENKKWGVIYAYTKCKPWVTKCQIYLTICRKSNIIHSRKMKRRKRKRGSIMKVVNYKGFKDIPVCSRVVYLIGIVCALIGIVTIMLSVFEIVDIMLYVSLAFVVASQLITQPILHRYNDKICKEIGNK